MAHESRVKGSCLTAKIDESMTNEHQRASRSTDSASAVGVMPGEDAVRKGGCVSRRRLTMPRYAATAGYNVAFFRITHIAVPLYKADYCLSRHRARASTARIREADIRHEGKKGERRENATPNARAGSKPLAYQF